MLRTCCVQMPYGCFRFNGELPRLFGVLVSAKARVAHIVFAGAGAGAFQSRCREGKGGRRAAKLVRGPFLGYFLTGHIV